MTDGTLTVQIIDTFLLVLPLFLVIGAGWGFAAATGTDDRPLSVVLVDFFMPALVFVSLYDSTVNPSGVADLVLSVLFIFVCQLILLLAYRQLAGKEVRTIALPVLFMNSGFLGFPVMHLWGGADALSAIVVFDQVYTLILFTFGLLIVGGGLTVRGLRMSLSSPILWAAVLGFACNLLHIPIPEFILKAFRFVGDAAPPLAAFVVGLSLSTHKLVIGPAVIWGILIRTVGGLLLGVAAVYILGLSGFTRSVVIVAAALPSAVFSYVLSARYGLDATDARTIVLIGTALSVITIPLSFILAAHL